MCVCVDSMLCLLFTIDVQASPPSCIRPHTNQHLAVRWYWTYLSKTKLVVSRLQSNKDWNIAMYNVCWFVFVFNKRHTHTFILYMCNISMCIYIYTHLCVYVCLCIHACVYMYIYMIMIDSVWVCVYVLCMHSETIIPFTNLQHIPTYIKVRSVEPLTNKSSHDLNLTSRIRRCPKRLQSNCGLGPVFVWKFGTLFYQLVHLILPIIWWPKIWSIQYSIFRHAPKFVRSHCLIVK